MEEPEGKKAFVLIRCRLFCYFKLDLKEIIPENVDEIYLAQPGVQ
jgi:hypothetical protein